MIRLAPPVGIPCAICSDPSRRIASWSETADGWAADCGHTLAEIAAVVSRILADMAGQPVGTPITSGSGKPLTDALEPELMCAKKASDISDESFLAAVDRARHLRSEADDHPWSWATRWDVAAVLAGHPEHVGACPVEYPHMPEKVVLAKARRLVRRGLLDACTCGCRGDFERKATPPTRRIES
jgi:hypothetical protein